MNVPPPGVEIVGVRRILCLIGLASLVQINTQGPNHAWRTHPRILQAVFLIAFAHLRQDLSLTFLINPLPIVCAKPTQFGPGNFIH